jgi:hypothetical protein
MTEPFPENVTIGEKYGPAMRLTDQAEADAYFERCVEHTMRFVETREEAEKVERINLGYFAGYYSAEIRERVERLFRCRHPLLGSIAKHGQPTNEEAVELGETLGKMVR